MIEFTSVAFALLYSMLLLRWVREGRALLFAGTLAAGGMAYISKSTTMFGFVYFLALYIPYILYELYKEKEGEASLAGAVRYYAGKPVLTIIKPKIGYSLKFGAISLLISLILKM